MIKKWGLHLLGVFAVVVVVNAIVSLSFTPAIIKQYWPGHGA